MAGSKLRRSYGAVFVSIVIAAGMAAFSVFAQTPDGSAPAPGAARSELPAAIEAGSVSAPDSAIQAAATSSSAAPAAQTPSEPTAAQPRPATTAPAVPAPVAPLAAAPAAESEGAAAPAAEEGSGGSAIVLAGIGAVAALAIASAAARLARKRKAARDSAEPDGNDCDSIKEFLEKKKKELEEMVRSFPENKLKEKIQGFAEEKLLTDDEREALRRARELAAKYDSLKEAIELLTKRYDLCRLKLPPGAGSLVLRRARPEDIAALVEIERSVAGSRIYSPMTAESEWREEFAKDAVVYLILKDGVVAGDVSYEMRGRGAYISGLAIKPEFQKQGIGREVMRRILEELKDAERIELAAHPENAPALRLYASLGFAVEGKKENYYGDGEPRLILARRRAR